MATLEAPPWERCKIDGCIGVRLATGGRCWAHAGDQDADTALKRLREGGNLGVGEHPNRFWR
jgi:hypothetical protein